jgi:hypothetical protein
VFALSDDGFRRRQRHELHLERLWQQLFIGRQQLQPEQLELERQLQPGHDRLSGGMPSERLVLRLDQHERQPGELERQQQRRQLHRRRRELRPRQLLHRPELRFEQQHLCRGDADSGRRRRGPELRIRRGRRLLRLDRGLHRAAGL